MAEGGLYPHHPFFLKRFGIKTVMLMKAWTLRFGFFAFGDPSRLAFVLCCLLSMIVYGCAFDFFNISGSRYLWEKEGGLNDTPARTQGLFMTMVNGVGAWIGSLLSEHVPWIIFL